MTDEPTKIPHSSIPGYHTHCEICAQDEEDRQRATLTTPTIPPVPFGAFLDMVADSLSNHIRQLAEAQAKPLHLDVDIVVCKSPHRMDGPAWTVKGSIKVPHV